MVREQKDRLQQSCGRRTAHFGPGLSKQRRWISGKKAEGKLIGGNLSLITKLSDELDFEGKILFLEEFAFESPAALVSGNIYSLKDAKYVILYEDRLIVLNDINNKGQIYPEPLILNSKINTRILSSINMNKNFLFKILKNENLNLEDIYFATYKNKKLYIIKKERLN